MLYEDSRFGITGLFFWLLFRGSILSFNSRKSCEMRPHDKGQAREAAVHTHICTPHSHLSRQIGTLRVGSTIPEPPHRGRMQAEVRSVHCASFLRFISLFFWRPSHLLPEIIKRNKPQGQACQNRVLTHPNPLSTPPSPRPLSVLAREIRKKGFSSN